MNNEKAIEYLTKNPLLHMDMLETIREGDAQLLHVSRKGVLLYHKTCEAMMMSAEDENVANRMLDKIQDAQMFVVHQQVSFPPVQKRFGIQEGVICRQAVYAESEPLPPVPCPAEIRQLNERHLPFIMEHYTRADEEAYQLERLRAGVMFGAFINGSCAGFIGNHAEGSIGMLEVLPEYRRQGIASALETFVVNRLLSEGKVPFAQIVIGNEASFELHRKLRFSISDDTLCWFTKE